MYSSRRLISSTLLVGLFGAPGCTDASSQSETAAPPPPTFRSAGSLQRWRAWNDDVTTYCAYEFSDAYDYHRVYIDTDEDAGSGFSHCGLGAEFLVENSNLYFYTGDGSSWSWSWHSSVNATIDSSSAQWSVARSALGETGFPAASDLCFEAESSGNGRDTTGVYPHVYSDESAPIHAHVASNDGSTIYYRADFDTSYNYKHVFIDTDENAGTGFDVAGIGAEFMIENNSLYDYDGDGSSWAWTSLGSANMTPSTPTSTGTTTWTLARSTVGETAGAEAADIVFHGAISGGGDDETSVYAHVYSTFPGGSGLTVVDDYTSNPDPEILNPERGIYEWSANNQEDPNADPYHTLVIEFLHLDDVCGQTILWDGLDAGNSTSQVLADFAGELQTHRDAGRKVIFRPRYDDEDGSSGTPSSSDCSDSSAELNSCETWHASTWAIQKNHVQEVAKMLGEYSDVVALVEAGYLGRWGEWNTHGCDDDTAPFLTHDGAANRRVDLLREIVSNYRVHIPDRAVGLRRPQFVEEVLQETAGDAVPIQDVELGFYNDCFMTTSSDYGTFSNMDTAWQPAFSFSSTQDAKDYAQDFTATSTFGGETCGDDPDFRWTDCDNMIGSSSEPADYHMAYLHTQDNTTPTTIQQWKNGGCWDEIRRRLGYRFEIESVEYTPSVGSGQTFEVRVHVNNTGWARLHRPRNAVFALDDGSTRIEMAATSGGDVSQWLPGTTSTVTLVGTAPSTGTYDIALELPDVDSPSEVGYAIQIASLDNGTPLFDATEGDNELGIQLDVQ